MRPPANIIAGWIKEKNSFSVRGLVLLRGPDKTWLCNIDILRASREKLDEMPIEEASFEIALSAVFRYITRTVYAGENVKIKNTRGSSVLVPKIAFELAPFLVDRIKKILQEGGGGINVNQIATTQKHLARLTTGDPRNFEVYGLPQTPGARERIQHRLNYEAKLTDQEHKAMMRRRRTLARHWLRRKGGSFRIRGLVYSSDDHGFWAFNVKSGQDVIEQSSTDRQALEALALDVSMDAVHEFASSVNYEHGGNTLLGQNRSDHPSMRVPPDVVDAAARRVAKKLLAMMEKYRHGVLNHKIIERSLAMAWDPEDSKPLEDYPFPQAPTADLVQADKEALDKISAGLQRNRARTAEQADQQPAAGHIEPAQPTTWREELEIEDWVPLDEVVDDDETIDRKALEKADHDQSAALRRIRGSQGGKILPNDMASPVKHKVDYAGLPSDDAD